MDLLFLGRRFQALSDEDKYNQVQLMTMSAVDFLDQWFETDVLKATMSASGIIGTFLGVLLAMSLWARKSKRHVFDVWDFIAPMASFIDCASWLRSSAVASSWRLSDKIAAVILARAASTLLRPGAGKASSWLRSASMPLRTGARPAVSRSPTRALRERTASATIRLSLRPDASLRFPWKTGMPSARWKAQ